MNNGFHTTQRLVIVSNRLPFTVEQRYGQIEFKESAGGVATGLKSLLETLQDSLPQKPESCWVGWPGSTVSDEQKPAVLDRARAEYRSCPVFLSEEDFDKFYEGF